MRGMETEMEMESSASIERDEEFMIIETATELANGDALA